VIAAAMLVVPPALGQDNGLTPTTINSASLADVPAELVPASAVTSNADGTLTAAPKVLPSAAVVVLTARICARRWLPRRLCWGDKPDGVIT
jgi:hypothetical protein